MQKLILVLLFIVPNTVFSQIIWSDDFSDPSTWNIDHDENTCNLDWQIGPNLSNQGNFALSNIYSSSSANGFAMLDSDYYGQVNGGEELEDSWFTNNTPIDLSDVPNAILEFESHYYRWIYEECYVVVSTTNTDWPILSPEFEADSNPNVFLVWPDMEVQDLVNNPTLIQFDISEIAGGQSQVWIRFNWTGSYGYSWFIDDVKILEQAAYDVKMEYGKVAHVNSDIRYHQIPSGQFDNQLYFSSLVKNIGHDTLTNVKIDLELLDSNSDPLYQDTSINYAILLPGNSFSYSPSYTLSLSEGLYSANYKVLSDEDQDGDQFENNSIESKFEITHDLFSIDGIALNDQSNTLAIGSNSFIDAADESYILSQYALTKDTTNAVYGLEVLLSADCQAGGTLIGHVFNASEVLDEIVSNPLLSSEELVLTQDQINTGWVRLYFETVDSLDAGDYMAGIEMYSNDNSNTISILNDISYIQDSEASVMIIDGVLNTTPNAAAIRLVMTPEDYTGINEIKAEVLLTQNSPNPASFYTNISFTLPSKQKVYFTLADSFGKIMYTKNLGNLSIGKHAITLDLNDYSSGIYFYTLHAGNVKNSRQMLIIK